MIQGCIDLALFRAFTPDSQDIFAPLARRFARRPLLGLTMYKDGFEMVPITFVKGVARWGEPQFAPSMGEEADSLLLSKVAERHKAKDCVINLTTGYTAVLSSRTRRAENATEALMLMRDNPERLLGEPPAQGCRHSIAYHPTHSFAVVFAHKESDINGAAALAARANLGVARLQCGVSSLLTQLFAQHWAAVAPEAEILLVDRGSLFYLSAGETGLGRPLFDVGLKEAALKQAIAERIGKLKPGGRVVLVDSSGLDVGTMIRERGGITVVTPLAEEKHPQLRACCSDLAGVSYDLFPTEREVRPFAPAQLRVIPMLFWASAAAAVIAIGINTVRQARAGQQSHAYNDRIAAATAASAKWQSVMSEVKAKQQSAQAMRDWLMISPATEPLLVQITKEVETATKEAVRNGRSLAQVDSLSLTMQDGQPQMRLVLVLFGDASAANRVFQRISTLFSRLGYSTVDLKQTLVPQGFRYEHLLNMPKVFGS